MTNFSHYTEATLFTITLTDALRAIAQAVQVPVIIVLLLFMLVTLYSFGALVVDWFTERVQLKAKLPALADSIREGGDLESLIRSSGLLKRQKLALLEIISHPNLTPAMRDSLAVRIVTNERAYYEGITWVTDTVARLGPMLGLLGTLIPLGPGIIALGQGDTITLSHSMLTAFDTTIAGLISASVAFVISGVRKRMYVGYLASLEMLTECVLETVNDAQIQEMPEYVREALSGGVN
jgi:biopolymer transport protein ExbB/TolQ